MQKHNFTIYQGLTFGGLQLIALDASGDPVTQNEGTTYLMQARKGAGQALAFEVPVERGTEADGQILIPQMDETATAELPLGTFEYDLVPIDAGGDAWPPILAGRITVAASISVPE